MQLQRDKLQALESRLLGCEAEMQDWEESTSGANEVRRTTDLPVTCSIGTVSILDSQVFSVSLLDSLQG